ncbi:hypothetical protein KCP73_08560 [Salmonella enterica subsp. enterica]|nr:hypothetical protein KCP73_08560 [Salmonella enterica subsp. enterica]
MDGCGVGAAPHQTDTRTVKAPVEIHRFYLKIQVTMDLETPGPRAFMRVVSGKYEKGMLRPVRTGKDVVISDVTLWRATVHVEEAYRAIFWVCITTGTIQTAIFYQAR